MKNNTYNYGGASPWTESGSPRKKPESQIGDSYEEVTCFSDEKSLSILKQLIARGGGSGKKAKRRPFAQCYSQTYDKVNDISTANGQYG